MFGMGSLRGQRQENFNNWLCRQQGVMPRTAMRYVLEAFIPFSEANMKLANKPGQFFDELERRDDGRYAKTTIRQAYFEAKRKGLIVMGEDGAPILSEEAERLIHPYTPRKLKGAGVMVVFDIPVAENNKRRWFRLLLKELKFEQVQKSVWMSDIDCFEVLSAGILEQQLEDYVRVFEARQVK
jgi:CRISPR/Cas system-associated endoribonuclease Cas2